MELFLTNNKNGRILLEKKKPPAPPKAGKKQPEPPPTLAEELNKCLPLGLSKENDNLSEALCGLVRTLEAMGALPKPVRLAGDAIGEPFCAIWRSPANTKLRKKHKKDMAVASAAQDVSRPYIARVSLTEKTHEFRLSQEKEAKGMVRLLLECPEIRAVARYRKSAEKEAEESECPECGGKLETRFQMDGSCRIVCPKDHHARKFEVQE